MFLLHDFTMYASSANCWHRGCWRLWTRHIVRPRLQGKIPKQLRNWHRYCHTIYLFFHRFRSWQLPGAWRTRPSWTLDGQYHYHQELRIRHMHRRHGGHAVLPSWLPSTLAWLECGKQHRCIAVVQWLFQHMGARGRQV